MGGSYPKWTIEQSSRAFQRRSLSYAHDANGVSQNGRASSTSALTTTTSGLLVDQRPAPAREHHSGALPALHWHDFVLHAKWCGRGVASSRCGSTASPLAQALAPTGTRCALPRVGLYRNGPDRRSICSTRRTSVYGRTERRASPTSPLHRREYEQSGPGGTALGPPRRRSTDPSRRGPTPRRPEAPDVDGETPCEDVLRGSAIPAAVPASLRACLARAAAAASALLRPDAPG